mgnify:CR=1 FL=1
MDTPPETAPIQEPIPPKHMSNRDLYVLSAATAVVTANAYYIHPIISLVADDFGISHAMIGMVPAFNQIALALGILLLLPLGDWVSNRRLTGIFVAAQFLSVAVMAFAQDYWLFVTGSTVLGFFTIAPYLLPTYVSKRVGARELGKATAIITTGIIGGILLARAGAGVLGQYFGWRSVYFVAAALMLAVTVALPLIMEKRDSRTVAAPGQSYAGLLLSIGPIIRQNPEILLSGTIQALGFGIFLSIWMGLGLHLTSPEMGYGVDVVGYLALFAIFNLFTTPRLGAWADRVGPRRARLTVASTQLIVIMNVGGPLIDICNRMTFLNKAPEIRTRLMTVYIVMMFIGGGAASWAGTTAYDLAGWHGNAILALCMSVCLWTLSFLSVRGTKKDAKA